MAALLEPVTLDGVDGPLSGRLAHPEGDGPAPGIVVLPEIDGLGDDTFLAATRLAGAGYRALALDLFGPYGGTPDLRGAEQTLAWTSQLNDHRQLSDLAAGLEWLADRPDVDAGRLALVGFSVGGRYSLLLGTEPRGLRAVVTFYTRVWPSPLIGGRVLVPGDHVGELVAPVCSIFGDEDDIVPADMVERYRSLLLEHPGNQVHVVPGSHMFTNPSRRRRYRPESAEQAWALALAFLDERLGP